MAKRVTAGNFYVVAHCNLFDILGGMQVGEIVQVVNPPGGRTKGSLRHVMREDGQVTFFNIENLEPYRAQ